MSIWTALIAGLFIMVGGSFLLSNIVTGTSTSDAIVTMILPVVLGVAVVGFVVKVFVF